MGKNGWPIGCGPTFDMQLFKREVTIRRTNIFESRGHLPHLGASFARVLLTGVFNFNFNSNFLLTFTPEDSKVPPRKARTRQETVSTVLHWEWERENSPSTVTLNGSSWKALPNRKINTGTAFKAHMQFLDEHIGIMMSSFYGKQRQGKKVPTFTADVVYH